MVKMGQKESTSWNCLVLIPLSIFLVLRGTIPCLPTSFFLRSIALSSCVLIVYLLLLLFFFPSMTGEPVAAPSSPRDGEDVPISFDRDRPRVYATCYSFFPFLPLFYYQFLELHCLAGGQQLLSYVFLFNCFIFCSCIMQPIDLKLGTMMGVFIPCLQNILGIIYYIRFSW